MNIARRSFLRLAGVAMLTWGLDVRELGASMGRVRGVTEAAGTTLAAYDGDKLVMRLALDSQPFMAGSASFQHSWDAVELLKLDRIVVEHGDDELVVIDGMSTNLAPGEEMRVAWSQNEEPRRRDLVRRWVQREGGMDRTRVWGPGVDATVDTPAEPYDDSDQDEWP